MLNIFHVSRHGTDLDINVGLTGLEVSFAFSGREDTRRSVLLTKVEQFGSLIRSLEHSLGDYEGWHSGINSHEVNDADEAMWMLSGGFRQNSVKSGKDEWIYLSCAVCYYAAFKGSYSAVDYSLHFRRTEAERLLNIFKMYIL
jgi:hypothetical protein